MIIYFFNLTGKIYSFPLLQNQPPKRKTRINCNLYSPIHAKRENSGVRIYKIQNTKMSSAENRHMKKEYFAWARKTSFLLKKRVLLVFFHQIQWQFLLRCCGNMLLRSVGSTADGYQHERYHNYLAQCPCEQAAMQA